MQTNSLTKLGVVSAVCLALVAVVGCGSGQSLVFGELDQACPSFHPDSASDRFEAASCFASEVEAGRPVVWDVFTFTTEGPIIIRHDYDGQIITVTEDRSRDAFGDGKVAVKECEGIHVGASGQTYPSDCKDTNGPGFSDEGF